MDMERKAGAYPPCAYPVYSTRPNPLWWSMAGVFLLPGDRGTAGQTRKGRYAGWVSWPVFQADSAGERQDPARRPGRRGRRPAEGHRGPARDPQPVVPSGAKRISTTRLILQRHSHRLLWGCFGVERLRVARHRTGRVGGSLENERASRSASHR